VALYGSEAWTIGKVDQKRLEAFETGCWRRLLKIKWTDKIRNEEVYRRIDGEWTLWNNIEKRRTRWIGHTLRQWTREEYNRRKNRGKSTKRKAKG
jgi:hypothetical protein